MSILSDIDKTLNNTDLYLWYNEQYIPFVLDHIEDVINLTSQVYGNVNAYWVNLYAAYIADDCLPVHIDKSRCIQWLLDNNKVLYDSKRDLYYTDDFLQDSSFMAKQFNYFYEKALSSITPSPPEPDLNPSHINWNWTLETMPNYLNNQGEPRPFVLKCDYSKEMQSVVLPAVITT